MMKRQENKQRFYLWDYLWWMGGEMEAGKTNRQGRWRNDALDLYLRSFDIPYDDCYYPAFSRCVGIVAMCRF